MLAPQHAQDMRHRSVSSVAGVGHGIVLHRPRREDQPSFLWRGGLLSPKKAITVCLFGEVSVASNPIVDFYVFSRSRKLTPTTERRSAEPHHSGPPRLTVSQRHTTPMDLALIFPSALDQLDATLSLAIAMSVIRPGRLVLSQCGERHGRGVHRRG